MESWTHQIRGMELINAARSNGVRSVISVAPCGSGKSRVMLDLAVDEVVLHGGSTNVYLHRSLLLEQLSASLSSKGIPHGIQAAGFEPDFDQSIQLCSVDTVYARAIRTGRWSIGSPTLVIFDEAHNQTSGKARAIAYGATGEGVSSVAGHHATGAFILGFSATPVNCGEFYEKLIGFASYRECREVNAHLPVRVYSPSEIDCAGLSTSSEGEYSAKEVEKRSTAIVGDTYQGWKRLNPDARPAILFAPSVEGSIWFAEQWCKFGVPVAHLDGKHCHIPIRTKTGAVELEKYDTSPYLRAEILEMSRKGEIKVLCNRFVLREAIDMPWLYHGIGATVFGGLATYLQSVGRVQRYWPEYEYKIWQDHGGGFHRHGSPNEERPWSLGCTNVSMGRARIEAIQRSKSPKAAEGICCPQCHGWRRGGDRCVHCGHAHKQSIRSVRMVDGELKLQRGVVNRAKVKKAVTADSLWIKALFRASAIGQPVSSAIGMWAKECRANHIMPDASNLKYRPPETDTIAYHQKVSSVFPWTARKKKEESK